LVERIYEGMYLVDLSLANDWSRAEAAIQRLMDRAGAKLLFCKKWDERRLAYEIQGRRRGAYILTFFKAPTTSIAGLERDVRLTDGFLRALILHREHMTEEKIAELGDRLLGEEVEPFAETPQPAGVPAPAPAPAGEAVVEAETPPGEQQEAQEPMTVSESPAETPPAEDEAPAGQPPQEPEQPGQEQ